MRILHVSPTHYSPSSVIGGGEKYVAYMAAALEGRSVHGTTLTNRMLSVADPAEAVDLAPERRDEWVVGQPWDAHSIDADELRERLAPHDVVVSHQCLSAFGLLIAAHAKAMGKIVVGMDHGGGEHPLVHHTPETGLMFDLFVAYSEFGSGSFSDIYGRVAVIRGPLDTRRYPPGPKDGRDPTKVVVLGRALPHKAFDDVIEALPATLTLVVLSSSVDETYLGYLKELAKEARGRVEFHLGLPDRAVRRHLQEAGLFVHASVLIDRQGFGYPKSELLGLAPLEAMSCGTPALVRATGALTELGRLSGCVVFDSTAQLQELLKQHSTGSLTWPEPEPMHAEVVESYGLDQFGSRLADELVSLVDR